LFGITWAKFDIFGISGRELKNFGITLAKIKMFYIGGAKVETFFCITRAKLKRMNISWGKGNKFGIRKKLWQEGKKI
jgi:hypothetical protein